MDFAGIRIGAARATAMATPALGADQEMTALKPEFKRLAERIESLERHNQELENGLTSDRISGREPDLAARLKAVENQTQQMLKPMRQIGALDDITVGASLTGVAREVGAGGTATGGDESRANYRGDLSASLPGGKIGDIDGKIFTHFRFGQGIGVPLRPTYTNPVNTKPFETAAGTDDAFAVLARAWCQLAMPPRREGGNADAGESLNPMFGKIDPFVFFDQNAAAVR